MDHLMEVLGAILPTLPRRILTVISNRVGLSELPSAMQLFGTICPDYVSGPSILFGFCCNDDKAIIHRPVLKFHVD